MKDDQLLRRIVVDSEIMVGKPIIQGTRLSGSFTVVSEQRVKFSKRR